MRVLAFVNKEPGISPGQRFRIEQWAPHLSSAHGIEIDYAVFESSELTGILYQPGRVREKATHLLADTWRRRRDVLRAFVPGSLAGGAVLALSLVTRDALIARGFDEAVQVGAVLSLAGMAMLIVGLAIRRGSVG